jgi:hypothetical protein
MREFCSKILCVTSMLVVALPGCSDGERAITGQGKLASIEQRPSLANPLKAAKTAPKQAVRRDVIRSRTAH